MLDSFLMVSRTPVQNRSPIQQLRLRICDMLHAALFSHSVYLYGVTFYLDPLELEVPTWYVYSTEAGLVVSEMYVS